MLSSSVDTKNDQNNLFLACEKRKREMVDIEKVREGKRMIRNDIQFSKMKIRL